MKRHSVGMSELIVMRKGGGPFNRATTDFTQHLRRYVNADGELTKKIYFKLSKLSCKAAFIRQVSGCKIFSYRE